MRARVLKPGFFMNEELARLPVRARLLFAGLWGLADREGRLENRPERIRAAIFPYERVRVMSLLQTLEKAGFVKSYQSVAGPCLLVAGFATHQRPHPKEPESKLVPLPDLSTAGSDLSTAGSSGSSGSSVPKIQDQDQEQLAPRAVPLDDRPAVLLKVAHTVLDDAEAQVIPALDVPEEVKRRAARAHLRYDGDRLRKALESAIVQRQHAVEKLWKGTP